MGVDLSATQPDCEGCGAPRSGLLHERSDLFLCRNCCNDWDDEHPDDTSLPEGSIVPVMVDAVPQLFDMFVEGAWHGSRRRLDWAEAYVRDRLVSN